jgi:hypothetical protein
MAATRQLPQHPCRSQRRSPRRFFRKIETVVIYHRRFPLNISHLRHMQQALGPACARNTGNPHRLTVMKAETDAFNYMELIGHIFNSVINLVFGVIIGVILHALLNLFVTNWIAGVFASIFSVVIVLALFAMETIIDWLFRHHGVLGAMK